jgi:hypothetical protein
MALLVPAECGDTGYRISQLGQEWLLSRRFGGKEMIIVSPEFAGIRRNLPEFGTGVKKWNYLSTCRTDLSSLVTA